MARARRVDGQMDLFGGLGMTPRLQAHAQPSARPRPVLVAALPAVTALGDEALLAELPGAPLARALEVMAEAGRRGLAAAVPLLATRCRLLAGHAATGLEGARPGRDLLAALDALSAIGSAIGSAAGPAAGGSGAATALHDLIAAEILKGAALAAAVAAATRLQMRADRALLQRLLTDPCAEVRAGACRLVRQTDGAVIAILEQSRLDPDRGVADAATCALGRLGRVGVRDRLYALVDEAPSLDLVAALTGVLEAQVWDRQDGGGDAAARDTLAHLARLAQHPATRDAVLASLDAVEDNAAAALAARLRRGDAA